MTRPENVTVEEWGAAVTVASRDRLHVALLVAQGTVRRVRGERALTLPARPSKVNLAIRSKRKKRR